jgi:hypothetical protein
MSEMEPKPAPEAPATLGLEPATRDPFETLLDDLAAASRPFENLSEEALRRVLENRPFAPWEVRHRQSWRLPFLAGSTLLGTASVLGLSPVFRLGPATAISFWTDVLLTATVKPVQLLWSARGLVAEAGEILRGSLAGEVSWILFLLLGLSAAGVAAMGRATRRLRQADAGR